MNTKSEVPAGSGSLDPMLGHSSETPLTDAEYKFKASVSEDPCNPNAHSEWMASLCRTLERENAALKKDAERMDWLEATLVSLHRQGPYMDGCNVGGQLLNKSRDDKGMAGPSYIKVHHRRIRDAIDEAISWPNTTIRDGGSTAHNSK